MSYLLHISIMICLYAILGLSLNMVVGYSGMLSLCHAAFYGIGAYVSTLLMIKAAWPFLPSLLAAMVLAGIAAYLISIPSVRFHGDFFVLATLAFQVIIFSLLYNWTDLTKGPDGITGVPRPSMLGLELSSPLAFLALSALMATGVWLLSRQLLQAAYGRTLQAVRDDELAASALGKDTRSLKRRTFTLAGMLAAAAGVLFATYTSYIDPTSFTLDESIFVLCAVIIGGAGSLHGPIVGAAILVALPEVLRFLRIPDPIAANARQIIYGLTLVLMMRFRPQGIAGGYAFD